MKEIIGIKPYQGGEPYIFVSYAHRDRDRIEVILRRLFASGYRIWYDEGIDPGTEWDNNIASHIEGCGCLLAFISANYLNSDNCKDELNFARDLQKDRLLVYLEDVRLPLGMAMRLNRLQAIHQYVYAEQEELYEKLLSVPMFERCLGVGPAVEPSPMPVQKAERRIKVIGVGGAGNNIVARMMEKPVDGVEHIAVNSDAEALDKIAANKKLFLNIDRRTEWTPENIRTVCEDAVKRQREEIAGLLSGADIAFLTCGLGGFTGTGAVAAIAAVAREMGILTVGVASTPFSFEGSSRDKIAKAGLEWLKQHADTLVILHNDRLLSVIPRGMTMADAFRFSDETLIQGVRSIADLIARPGIVRLDFDVLCEAIRGKGLAYLGVGLGEGPGSIVDAARKAIDNPLLETRLKSARSVLVNVTGTDSMSVDEINQAAGLIHAAAGADAGVVLGTATDEDMGDQARVMIIATGLG